VPSWQITVPGSAGAGAGTTTAGGLGGGGGLLLLMQADSSGSADSMTNTAFMTLDLVRLVFKAIFSEWRSSLCSLSSLFASSAGEFQVGRILRDGRAPRAAAAAAHRSGSLSP
jgi:hypothetical protein